MLLRWAFYAILLCMLAGWAGKAAAGGLNRIGGIGPRAGAMGGAYTAIADDASLFYYNPAGMTRFTEPYAEVGADLLFPRFTYDHRTRGRAVSAEFDWHALPLMGYVHPLGDSAVAGIGVYVPFGMGADFEDNPQKLGYHTTSLICLTNVSPAVAFRINEQLSVGLSLDIGYEQFRCKTPFDIAGHCLPLPTDSKGDGFGLGGSVGVLWDSEKVSLGARYSTHTEVDIDGATHMGAGLLAVRDGFSSECTFPERLGAGIAIHPSDRWQVSFDANWYGYTGDIDELVLDFDTIPMKKAQRFDWQDNCSFHAGLAYALDDAWTVRTGYTYVEAAVPDETLSTLTPDSDGHNVSVGIECRRDNLTLGGFVLYGWGEHAVGRGLRKEEYDADIFTVGFQGGWRF